jgi:soluble P-type ATPase
MIEINIPGQQPLCLEHLALDFNGTLAVDGRLIKGLAALIRYAAEKLTVHIITADTFGQARSQVRRLPCKLVILDEKDQAQAKLKYVRELGAEQTVCIGNGNNDRLMLAEAALGIAVIMEEGASCRALEAADVAVKDIRDAFGLLLNPLRLKATLRE